MTTAPSLYEEAAAEIEAMAAAFREAEAFSPASRHRDRAVELLGTEAVDSNGYAWLDANDHDEYVRLMDLARRLRAADRQPDPLGEALNSGDGSYRP